MSNEDVLKVLGITPEKAEAMVKSRKAKGRRDARVCVCGHAGGAHYPVTLEAGEENRDIASFGEGEVGCQAGKTPCLCEQFVWVLSASDVRSFIYKTQGPGEEHALSLGSVASAQRGVSLSWRDDLACFTCGKQGETLIPIAYNDRGIEVPRSARINRMHCEQCRNSIRTNVASRG